VLYYFKTSEVALCEKKTENLFKSHLNEYSLARIRILKKKSALPFKGFSKFIFLLKEILCFQWCIIINQINHNDLIIIIIIMNRYVFITLE